MATYRFNLRLDRIVPHTATVEVEADNIADAIQQVRAADGDGAVWTPESYGYWGDDMVVDGMHRVEPALDFQVVADPIEELGLAWFKRMEAKQVTP
ncbi:hypothetical protein RY963_000932 [Stenotrophomonas maltophilia]|uniref:Uncharacterized protein n=1 Tax=Marilutibacter maris TaxID=1605891 RepID=A0A508B397_9GAMM|nr:hypothetical protein [Lysobacter maris]ELN2583950.1 hypothetical protein [Stenotrophomonas maltophilia]ELN2592105.1 hypothetical protein [Stenotrophomonas maltophilia]KAB8198726.1 hypothetical protein FKV24_000740 [Lysobacter maris]MBH1400023.1 hypothetical protein [Stenotrophomonas maltophilia]